MIDKKEVLMRLACAMLQGGKDPEKVVFALEYDPDGYNLIDIAEMIYPGNAFIDQEKDEDDIIDTKGKY